MIPNNKFFTSKFIFCVTLQCKVAFQCRFVGRAQNWNFLSNWMVNKDYWKILPGKCSNIGVSVEGIELNWEILCVEHNLCRMIERAEKMSKYYFFSGNVIKLKRKHSRLNSTYSTGSLQIFASVRVHGVCFQLCFVLLLTFLLFSATS